MRFQVIDGGLAGIHGHNGRTAPRGLSPADVEAEAKRRLIAAGYERCRVKHQVTGEAIPRALQHFRLQVNWVAETLASLEPIPADYTHDKYWPVLS